MQSYRIRPPCSATAACFVVSISLCFFSIVLHGIIVGDSFWIDEGTSAWLASHPTLHQLIETQKEIISSEAQMPLYVWYVWGMAKIVGLSEIALRLTNLPFVLLFCFVFQWGERVLFQTKWNWTALSLSPFFWFYINEARPYVAIMAFSALAVVSFLIYFTKRQHYYRLTPWLCLVGAFLCSAMSILGALLLPAFLITTCLAYRFDKHEWKTFLVDWSRPMLASFPLFSILGVYFAWTLLRGAGGKLESPGVSNLAFGAYEFLGLLGLGPPRDLLRANPTWSLISGYAATLSLGLVPWFLLVIASIFSVKRQGAPLTMRFLLPMLISGIALFFVVAFLFHFRFWGRHLSQFYPIFLLLLLNILSFQFKSRKLADLKIAALVILIIAWFFSSTRLSFSGEYKKEDYRSAADYAMRAAGDPGTILWSASPIVGSYYGLHFSSIENDVFWPTWYPAHLANNWTDSHVRSILETASRPIVIVMSKPDTFDRKMALSNIVAANQLAPVAALSAFRIYLIQ